MALHVFMNKTFKVFQVTKNEVTGNPLYCCLWDHKHYRIAIMKRLHYSYICLKVALNYLSHNASEFILISVSFKAIAVHFHVSFFVFFRWIQHVTTKILSMWPDFSQRLRWQAESTFQKSSPVAVPMES